MKQNRQLRQTLSRLGIYQYQLAEALKISEFTLSRRLRKKLTPEESDRYYRAIHKLSGGNANEKTHAD